MAALAAAVGGLFANGNQPECGSAKGGRAGSREPLAIF